MTVEYSRKKGVRGFLGGITSRKNPKKWAYLFGKTGHFCQTASSDACEGW
jgi:hypothetical protein